MYMTYAERDSWLASLKVGDEVAYNSSNFGINWEIVKIIKITATRRIKTENGITFNKDGYETGELTHRLSINPYTDKIKEAIEIKQLYNIVKGKLQNKLNQISTLNLDQLQELNEKLGDN